ncbi:MAG: hemolysin family protein [Candidatus Magasanikiibacteriota bacterium]
MIINIIILIILLALSAFFSASEVAFISLSDARVATMVKKKFPRADLIQKLKSQPRRLLITVLIGNNIVNIASASLATVIASDLFSSAIIGITTGVMTFLILVFGEITPKSYASSHRKKVAIISAPLLYFVQKIFWPIIIFFEWLANLLAGEHEPDQIHEDEVKAMAVLGRNQGNIESGEEIILNRLFEMNDIEVEDIMTKRKDIKFLTSNLTIDEAADVIVENPHTRLPVIESSLDNIIGLAYAKDILVAFNDDHEDRSIKKIIRPFFQVGPNLKIDDLLHLFQKKKIHMAVVKDIAGRTLGIVTLEDVLEELVGEIVDEHDES